MWKLNLNDKSDNQHNSNNNIQNDDETGTNDNGEKWALNRLNCVKFLLEKGEMGIALWKDK